MNLCTRYVHFYQSHSDTEVKTFGRVVGMGEVSACNSVCAILICSPIESLKSIDVFEHLVLVHIFKTSLGRSKRIRFFVVVSFQKKRFVKVSDASLYSPMNG